MKRIAAVLCFLCVLFAVWTIYDKKIEGTDLSGVFVDGFRLGTRYDEIDSSKYTPDEMNVLDADTVIPFRNVRINVEDGIVTGIFADVRQIPLVVNSASKLSNISDVTRVLDENYKEKWRDREQGLMEHIYRDSVHDIQASFVYAKHDGRLVWLILSPVGEKWN